MAFAKVGGGSLLFSSISVLRHGSVDDAKFNRNGFVKSWMNAKIQDFAKSSVKVERSNFPVRFVFFNVHYVKVFVLPPYHRQFQRIYNFRQKSPWPTSTSLRWYESQWHVSSASTSTCLTQLTGTP